MRQDCATVEILVEASERHNENPMAAVLPEVLDLARHAWQEELWPELEPVRHVRSSPGHRARIAPVDLVHDALGSVPDVSVVGQVAELKDGIKRTELLADVPVGQQHCRYSQVVVPQRRLHRFRPAVSVASRPSTESLVSDNFINCSQTWTMLSEVPLHSITASSKDVGHFKAKYVVAPSDDRSEHLVLASIARRRSSVP